MEHENMKRISLKEVQGLSNGTRVFVECIGSEWNLDDKNMKSWNIKQEDGLHYEIEDTEHTISFPYDYDYDNTNMSIVCYVGEYGCKCCIGDEPLQWVDEDNNAFIDSNGKISTAISGKVMSFKVKYCPNCGRKFV